MADDTHCYTAACPECKQVVAVAVADSTNEAVIRDALKSVQEWRADELIIGGCTVGDVRAGRIPLEHAASCVTGITVPVEPA